jgi:hypothetical protein
MDRVALLSHCSLIASSSVWYGNCQQLQRRGNWPAGEWSASSSRIGSETLKFKSLYLYLYFYFSLFLLFVVLYSYPTTNLFMNF